MKDMPSRRITQPIKQRMLYLRRNILALCGLTVIALWGVILYALHIEWIIRLDEEKVALIRHASVTSGKIHDSLVDASKILDAVRTAIEKQISVASPDRRQAYEIIRTVVQNFSIYNSTDTLGLILYLDKNGILLAQTGVYPTPAYDLTERGYFRALRDDPSKKFSIGKMRTAITSGKRVFHLSMPLHDTLDGFAGVVACQIREKELTESIDHMLKGIHNQILVQIPDDGTAFLYPPRGVIPSEESLLNEELLREINENRLERGLIGNEETGTLRISGANSAFRETTYVGYVKDPLFGLLTTARVPESEILSSFLHQNECLIGLAILTSLGISILFYRLYRKALSLDKSVHEASFDHLTLIRNRRSLEREFHRLWRDASRRKKPISLLFIDIDRFKQFNDTHGHAAGDRVLTATALVINRSLNRPLDLCCRWGGEEFLVLLPETTAEEALFVAERIRQRVGKMKLKFHGKPLSHITLSIGIAATMSRVQAEFLHKSKSGMDQRTTPEDLIARADKALLQAKELGRDRVIIG